MGEPVDKVIEIAMTDAQLSEPGEFFECFGIDFVVHVCLQGSLPDWWCARTGNISSLDT